MKRPVLLLLAASSLALFTACSGGSGSGSGGSLFVQSCSLGCSSGQGGSQVSCSISNTSVNQAISVAFSQAIDLSSVNSTTFQINEVVTGAVPNGTFDIDPLDPTRILFRPALSFSAQGSVEFGFIANRSYQIRIPGTAQGDSGPFVRSTGGNENRSRLLCTIQTTEGITDPVPGPPTAAVFVDTLDSSSGVITENVPANGATSVWLNSQITFTFDDLMDIGSLIIPANGTSPSIQVVIDGDGDPSTPGDQAAVSGTFAFTVDLQNLVTTVIFTPTSGLPSAGVSTPKHRIIVTLPPSIVDIVGNSITNPGQIVFEPEAIAFPPVALIETFGSTTNLESDQSGANMWGQSAPGGIGGQMLGKGVGGGSGRLGRLIIPAGSPTVLDTSPIPATATLSFGSNPCNGETFLFDGLIFTFTSSPMAATDLPRQMTLFETVDEAARLLNMLTFSQNVTFTVRNGTDIVITAPPGSAGNAFEIVPPATPLVSDTTGCASGGQAAIIASSATLVGGTDGQLFAARNLIDNFDFQANPGGSPSDILIDDGIFEFTEIVLQPGAQLRLRGDNPGRLFGRGRLAINNNARVDLAGESLGLHDHLIPGGIPGGAGGPNAGSGGSGGDRPTGMASGALTGDTLVNIDFDLDGSDGEGVGQQGSLAAGRGGSGWPTNPMTAPGGTIMLGDAIGVPDDANCTVAKIPGPGSGAAYAVDGGDGTTSVPLLITDNQNQLAGVEVPVDDAGVLNQVDVDMNGIEDVTPGGNAGALGIEPPAAPPDVRLLDPESGDLRGGAGGGGAGAGMFGASYTQSFSSDCLSSLFVDGYTSQSGASGGGGGGAAQFQSGNQLILNGLLDARGGDGGSGTPPLGDPASEAFLASSWSAPGGGGSGGAVLVQGASVSLSTVAGVRIDVSGGAGGTGVQGTLGGNGGAGLMRIEDAQGLLNPVTVAGLVAPMTPNTSEDVLSVGAGAYSLGTTLPRSFSGAQSCWMKPDGSFFKLVFDEDGGGTFGWDATIVVDFGGGPQEISYRDPAQNGGVPALGGNSPQQFWGNLIDRDLTGSQTPAPIVFRFQGAQVLDVNFTKVQPSDNFSVACNIDDSVQSSQIQGVTPWVQDPFELNDFLPPPSMVRWVVIFDESHPDAGNILGVSDVRIGSMPD